MWRTPSCSVCGGIVSSLTVHIADGVHRPRATHFAIERCERSRRRAPCCSAVRCRTRGALAPNPYMPVIVCVRITMTTATGFHARSACLERRTGHTVRQPQPASCDVVAPAAPERVDLRPLPSCSREHSSGRRVGESGGCAAITPLTVGTCRPFPGYPNTIDRRARAVTRDLRGQTSEPRCLTTHSIHCKVR